MTDPFASRGTTTQPTQETGRAGPGTTVSGRYTLRAAVGHGGMGTVWQATDGQLKRNVAVKEVVPPPGIAPEDREAMYQRMMREARAAAGLSHPGIVQVYDVVTDAGRPWVVMELLEARSLSDMVLQDGPLAPRAVAKIGVALLGALEVAHAAGVLHRDVKPANVLICNDGRCVLTDFGVARMPTDQQLTTPGMVLGSPHFISPERAMGKPFGPPSDLFSLGVTLYTAVEGRPPFDKGEPIATMHSVVEDDPPAAERAGALAGVLYGLLAKDPQHRWDTVTARQALRDLLAGPLASQSLQFPTDPYSVVPAPRRPVDPGPPAVRRTGAIGGRALLAPGEAPSERADPYGQLPDPYRQQPDPYQAADDATGVLPVTGGPADTSAGLTAAAEPAGGGHDETGGAGAGARDRAREVGGQARAAAGRSAVAARRLAGQGVAAARRLPRQAQLAAAAGVAVVLLMAGAWLFAGGTEQEQPHREVAAPEPTAGEPGGEGPRFEVQEYAGRGVALHFPADWQAGPDNQDLVYVDFLSPPEAAGGQLRLVVERWGGDAEGMVLAAEENIQNNSGCAEPYQRLDLTEQVMAGYQGSLLEYTCGQGDEQRRAKWATIVHDEVAYSLRLSVPDSQFAEFEVVFEEAVRSFQLTG